MAKRDIKINYDNLKIVAQRLQKQRNAMRSLRDAMRRVNKQVTRDNRSQAVTKLNKQYKKAKERLDSCYDEVDELCGLVQGYIRDMTGIIEPKRGMTRVGRNDVYLNLQSVKHGIEDIKNVQSNHPMIASSDTGLTDEEKQKMENNYNKIETEVWSILFPKLRKQVDASKERLQGYYNKKVVAYENKDDEYKSRSEKIRYTYSSPWEIYKQNKLDIAEFKISILKGALAAVVDLLKGVASIAVMLYHGVSACIAAVVYLLSSDPPDWVDEVLNDSEEYFGNIANAISHPVETVEAMAQSANDTYETEGLTYMVSYVVADFFAGKGVEKAVKATKGAKLANKADDAADIAKAADKTEDLAKAVEHTDDITDAAKAAEHTKEIEDVAKTAEHADDVKGAAKVENAETGAKVIKSSNPNVPDKAKTIAQQVKANNGAPPKGYKGGRTYKNIPLEEGAQKLPEGINYREYDINPHVKGQNRGTERIVIGDDGSVWYTNDHYKTFTKMQE